jgi:hypothetical protein
MEGRQREEAAQNCAAQMCIREQIAGCENESPERIGYVVFVDFPVEGSAAHA